MPTTVINEKIDFEIVLDDQIFQCILDPLSRKNLNVTIKAGNILYLSKPKALSKEHLIDYLQKNRGWILDRSEIINDVSFKRNSYITDEYVVVFGEKVYYKDNDLILEQLNEMLIEYVMNNRNQFDEVFGKEPSIQIVKLKGRWGACSPSLQNILLNEKLIHYPKHCINYVMTHEYLHLIIPNHSERFYRLLEELMPDYQKSIDYIRVN
ncbi:MAG: M48 family metallopeptidase [Erysipelothrix sp.]|nr:M48 family metallopeptidase [Erysipelothrix sp.]